MIKISYNNLEYFVFFVSKAYNFLRIWFKSTLARCSVMKQNLHLSKIHYCIVIILFWIPKWWTQSYKHLFEWLSNDWRKYNSNCTNWLEKGRLINSFDSMVMKQKKTIYIYILHYARAFMDLEILKLSIVPRGKMHGRYES